VAEARERRKELHFFDRYWAADPEPDYAERYASFFPRPEGSIAGEWTPRYMHDPWTLPLLAAAAPAARFLILLRDPIERYRSGLRHELERSRRRGQDPPNIAIMGDAVFRGFYRRQVERALELFGRDRVLVLQYERCVDAPLEQMRHTQQFLGLEPLSELTEPIQRDRRDSPAKPPLPDHLRGHLKEAYAGDVTALAELCPEIDPGLWPNFADG
jgi:hypothetical protein